MKKKHFHVLDVIQKEDDMAKTIYKYWNPSISQIFVAHKSILL